MCRGSSVISGSVSHSKCKARDEQCYSSVLFGIKENRFGSLRNLPTQKMCKEKRGDSVYTCLFRCFFSSLWACLLCKLGWSGGLLERDLRFSLWSLTFLVLFCRLFPFFCLLATTTDLAFLFCDSYRCMIYFQLVSW